MHEQNLKNKIMCYKYAHLMVLCPAMNVFYFEVYGIKSKFNEPICSQYTHSLPPENITKPSDSKSFVLAF